jgi:predicted O-methyltransferase YrrM
MTWDNWRDWLQDDERTGGLIEKTGNFEDTEVPDNYMEIWRKVSLEVQLDKAKRHQLTQEQTNECMTQLCKRPYYLTSLAARFGAKNIVEVGTAEGLQFFSFAEYAQKVGGHVWSCDLRDVRNTECVEKYEDSTTFLLGDSKKLASELTEPVDMYYIDASHEYGEVVRDVVNLRDTQAENPIWVFDDFDRRFGCYDDIKRLCQMSKKFKIYRVGNAASGNPNHQVVIFGRL